MLRLLLGIASPTTVIDRLFYSHNGQMIISAIFGVAVAFLFQKACNGRKCIVLHAPPTNDLNNPHKYKHGDNCYKFTPRYVDCD